MTEWRDYVCAQCGSDRLGAIQKGIDNLPIAQCFNCGPGSRSSIPEDDGTEKAKAKRAKAIRAATIRPTGSQKAIHAILRPVVERSQYKPKAKPVEAPTMGLFD